VLTPLASLLTSYKANLLYCSSLVRNGIHIFWLLSRNVDENVCNELAFIVDACLKKIAVQTLLLSKLAITFNGPQKAIFILFDDIS
jgi:hypothetical protein